MLKVRLSSPDLIFALEPPKKHKHLPYKGNMGIIIFTFLFFGGGRVLKQINRNPKP